MEDKEERKQIEMLKIPKYIGELSRSTFERLREHKSAFDTISSKSFMVKHYVDKHEEDDMEV